VASQRKDTLVASEDVVRVVPPDASGAGEPGSAVQEPVDEAAARGLTNAEIARYSRHLIMPEVGMDGQRKLKAAKVLCIGVGGLGSPVCMYLAAAGVGTLGLVDFDVVDFSNLQRQIVHGTPDVGRPKLDSAADRLHSLNPEITVRAHETELNSGNALDLLAGYDLVVDGTDNFPTRYLVNDACVLIGKPYVYGSVFRMEGQASVFATTEGPCYRCLHPDPPPPDLVPSCADAGVLGVLPGIIGTIQAVEALKLILGIGEPLIGRFLVFDALRMRFRELRLRKDPDCPVCGTHPTVRELVDYKQLCGIAPLAPDSGIPSPDEITPAALKERLDRGENLVIVDVREPQEYQINRIRGSILMPLGDVPRRYGELDPDRGLVMQCKVGERSLRAVAFLRSVGFRNVFSLKGGILEWIDKVDPTQPKY
jgi:sulfur-carrier protein adenylyltransferase/sulfurtransferase